MLRTTSVPSLMNSFRTCFYRKLRTRCCSSSINRPLVRHIISLRLMFVAHSLTLFSCRGPLPTEASAFQEDPDYKKLSNWPIIKVCFIALSHMCLQYTVLQ